MQWRKFEDLDPNEHKEVDLYVVYRGIGERFVNCNYVQPYSVYRPNTQAKTWCHLDVVGYDCEMGWDAVGGGEAVITHFLVVETP